MEKRPFDANDRKIKMFRAGPGNGAGHARRKGMDGAVRHGIRASVRNRGKKGPLPPEPRFVIGVLGHTSGMTERGVFPGNVRRNSKFPAGKAKKGRIGAPGPLFLPPFMFDIPIPPKRPSKPGKQDLEAEYRLERVYHKFFRRPFKPK